MFAYLKNENTKQRATFDVLGIGPHVLTTPSRTIALPSIATVTVGTDPSPRPRLALAVAGIVLVVATLAAASSPSGFGEGPLAWALLFAVGAIAALAAAILPGDRKTYLMVTTTDGLLTRFHGQDVSVLEQVREILTAKLDGGQPGLTCTVNFKTGALEPFRQAGTTAAESGAGAVQSAQGVAHGFDDRAAGMSPNPAQAAQPAPSPITAGRAAAPNSSARAGPQQRGANQPSPTGGRGAGAAPQSGSVNGYANGHMPAVLPTIDFFDLLPSVVEMHRFYARDPNAAHVERRLSELELLMRSGAQTQGQRTRIVELAQDLAHYLQGYPPAVRVFQDIAETVSR